MAVTAAQKAAFLEAHGKVKSLHYFMTGPNLGGDWSWSKALAGGYSPGELDGYFNKGQSAYNAHKSKDASTAPKKAADGPDPKGMGGACAKTAAKAVTTAVSQVKLAVFQGFSHLFPLKGVKVLTEGTFIDGGEALVKKLSALRAQIISELGENAPEVVHINAAIDGLKSAQTMKFAQDVVHDFQQGLIKFNTTGEILEELDVLYQSISGRAKQVALSSHELNILLADQASDAGDQLMALVAAWRSEIREQMNDMAWKVFANVAEEADTALFLNFKQLANVYDLESAPQALQAIRKYLDDFAEGLGYGSYQNVPLSVRQLEVNIAAREAIESIVDAQKAQALDLISPEDWLGGTTLQPGSPVTKYGTFSEFEDALNKLGSISEQVGLDVGTKVIFDVSQEVRFTMASAFNQAKATAAAQVPGSSTSALGFTKQQILDAGTDELNPAVQAVLEAHDEVPSLVYFMTKGQKQDLLTEGWDAFTTLHYTTKYKGQALEGGGLATAKQKYAIKQGSPPPKATVHAEKSTGSVDEALSKKVSQVDAGGVNTVTGEPTPLPPGSPSWWADPFTEKQAGYLESLITKNSLEEVFEQGGWYEAAKSGTLTKGQMHQAISLAQQLDEEVITFISAADVQLALKYGDAALGKSSVAQAVKAVETAGKSVDDVLASSLPGPTVSTAKPASGVAPTNPVWDAPHTWTYRGDGQSKWGGAHRKWWFEDEAGNDWMLKHGAGFRSEGELAAHRIAHSAGFDIAEARVVTLQVQGRSQTGVIQKMYRSDDIVGTLDDAVGRGALSELPEATLRQLQEHQVLDWLLGNHDSHMQNFLLLKDGRLVGVDKGQAFKFYGKDRLAHNYKPDGNFGTVAYNRMWDDYRAGRLNLDLDGIHDALSRIESMSDVQLARMVDAYAQGRFGAPASQAFLSGTSARNSAELLDQVLARKRNIRRDFEVFYQEQASARGVKWEPSWKSVKTSIHEAKPKVTSATDILTPIDAELAASLNRVGTNGKAVYVAGTEVERGQILFDLVTDTAGTKQLRMNAYLRPEADTKLMQLIRAEGGDAISASAGVSADIPQAVVTAAGWSQKTVAAAKTVNHHISAGDFAFNATSINEAVELASTISKKSAIAKWVREGLETVDDVAAKHPDAFVVSRAKLRRFIESQEPSPAMIDDWILKEAASVTELRAGMTYRKHLFESIAQSGLKDKAQKVDLVPSFDARAYFVKVRDEARVMVSEITAGAPVPKSAVPEKLFRSVSTENISTSSIRKGAGGHGLNDPVAVLQGWQPVSGTYGSQQYAMEAVINGKTARVVYRNTDTQIPTMKGWLEVVYDTGTKGDVDAADVAALHRWLNDSLGVSAQLAKSTDMELTYWRMVQGNYRLSESAKGATGWKRAVELADQRLSALGPAPTQAQEIEAIRGAYRQVFGAVIDEADTLPIHSRMASRDLDEIGWGFWERPELTGAQVKGAVEDRVLIHRVNGALTQEHAAASTGQGMVAQQERLRSGFVSSAMSAEADLGSGGASSFFTRLEPFSRAAGRGRDMVVMAPHRRIRRLLDYNAPSDTYGRLGDRGSRFTLDPQTARRYSSSAGNEFMVRDMASYFDDVELTFFTSRSARDSWVRLYKERGMDTIRGVPIEHRLVVRADVDVHRYIQEHFKKHVNPSERLRRSIDALRAGARAVSETVSETARVVSRFPRVSKGAVRKQVSVGRSKRISLIRPGAGRTSVNVRYHVGENALSIPGGLLDDWIVKSDAPFTFGQAALKGAGSGLEASPAGTFTLVDLAPFGIDIKTMTPGQRPRFMQQFLQGLMGGDGALAEVIQKWGGAIA